MGPPRTDQRRARERGDGRVACVGPLQGGKWNVGSRCAAVRTCSWPSSGRNAEELTGCGARYGRDFWSRQEAPGQAFERGMPAVSLWGRTGQALYKMKRLPRPRPPSIRGSARTRCFHPPRGRPHMPPISFTVNGKRETVNVTPDTPLLWVLRDTLGLTGTKFSCGIAQCGACTVHLDGVATRTCVLPVA